MMSMRARTLQGLDVAALDRAALAQVVAHHEGGPHRRQGGLRIGSLSGRQDAQALQQRAGTRHRLGAAGQRDQLFAPLLAEGRARPHRARGLRHRCHHRPAQPDREVQPRLGAAAVVQVDAVVDQVDAADEGALFVDGQQLLVQAAQLPGLQVSGPAVERAEHGERDAAALEPRTQHRQAGLGAEAVDHHAHAHAATRGGHQRIDHRARGLVVVEDVGREPDLVARRADRPSHRRKQFVAAGQQRDLVAAGQHRYALGTPFVRRRRREQRLHARSNSATSGRWSDMRAHAVPRGTCVRRQRNERV
jgi:hypothetical protein